MPPDQLLRDSTVASLEIEAGWSAIEMTSHPASTGIVARLTLF